MDSTAWIWIAVAIAVVVVLVVVALAVVARRRREEARRQAEAERLRGRFGPEYDRVLADQRDPQAAAAELSERERRHDSMPLRRLTAGEQQRYVQSWATIQAAFVDRPAVALVDADRMVVDLMRDSGYDVAASGDTDRMADDLSVSHANVVHRFRRAHGIATSGTDDIGRLRSALLDFRAVVEDLLGGARADVIDLRSAAERGRTDPSMAPAAAPSGWQAQAAPAPGSAPTGGAYPPPQGQPYVQTQPSASPQPGPSGSPPPTPPYAPPTPQTPPQPGRMTPPPPAP